MVKIIKLLLEIVIKRIKIAKNKESENEKYNSEVTKSVIKNNNKKFLILNIRIKL